MKHALVILKMGWAPQQVVQSHGDFEDWFLSRLKLSRTWSDWRLEVIDGTRGIFPEKLPRAILITGSLASVYDPLPFIAPAREFLRQALQEGVWLLGICFGHQLLAETLGGAVGPNPAGWETGIVPVRLTPAGRVDPLAGALAPQGETLFMAAESHRDVVLEPPPGAQVLAQSPLDPQHALRLSPRAWSFQFHPEMRAEHLRALFASPGDRPLPKTPCVFPDAASENAGTLLLSRFLELAGESS